jgi:hypothetical protein
MYPKQMIVDSEETEVSSINTTIQHNKKLWSQKKPYLLSKAQVKFEMVTIYSK